ncbi:MULTISPECIES: YceI family protein [unclassified Pseudomonas]|uniref:YceI family protein n=1 Tax=unclassified Pseudomonas TaxID=196821 RepID=UPI000876F60D|nr:MULTISPECIES: YceI family protein [unclassified Pseudomonas]SCZ41703.1 YceI-like domain-containing protein [Pseudomonas sp. NFACC44-2]SDA88030.1 YceI-like domain-containing protein [Pseudomonas sp. NFACC51]SEJ86019.1 YceI-like domain-containing protein [Pseudomonas sp. NFACC07-1]SFH82657.1 YceI-like domain-containing protein [Pseudomonas sp. NFACC54]SFS51026.1 YceI-like domain-containing protein [Pseudomonas sp. NFACC48-1]
MFKRFFPHAAVSLLLAGAALPAQADWYLDGESSRLSFISSKNGNVSEVQRFLMLHGQVQPEGLARLEVELESINSGIPLRDERMRAELFEIKQFADATVTAKIDLAPIQDLANGAQLELRLPLTVNLHGKQHEYNVELLATRLDERRFQVVTLEPVVLNAADFDLAPGLEKLRNLAGLSAISLSVPVNAVLIFTAR